MNNDAPPPEGLVTWQQRQREQESDRAAEAWQVTAEELESMASDYYQQEDDPLEEIR